MTTIRDVASRAQVSPATVSLMLNGRRRVGTHTRKRIEQAIAQLGYQHEPRSQVQSVRHSFNIAFVLPHAREGGGGTEHWLANEWIRGVQCWLAQHGHHLSLMIGGHHIDSDSLFRSMARDQVIDGVILGSTLPSDGYLEWLLARKIPVVVLNRTPKQHAFSSVQVDNVVGGNLAAEHLISQGHQRIACLHSARDVSWVHERLHGLRIGLQRHGLELTAVDSVAKGADPLPACQQLLDQQITAVFASHDQLAMACLEACHKLGVKVPDDLSIVGFDGARWTSSQGLQVSSISYDMRGLGETAVRLLTQIIQQPAEFTTQVINLRPYILKGDTSGPCEKTKGLLSPSSRC